MEATAAQKAAIRKLTRAANRRIERAMDKAPGQADWLQYQVERLTGEESGKFSAATKGLSYEQAAAKLEQLDRFMGYQTSTRKGWDEVKEKSVRNANETLKGKTDEEGEPLYDLTDEELADLLKQEDIKNKKEFYKAVNKVQAAKNRAGDEWKGTPEQIGEALAQQWTDQQALQYALESRQSR